MRAKGELVILMDQSQQEAGAGAVVDDPDQQGGGDEAATLVATMEGGSWYWTSMLNFSQSGSSSTHTSAGQLAGSQFTGSPPSSSSVHNTSMNPSNNSMSNNTNNNNQVDHTALPLDTMLPVNNNNNNDPENAVWSQDFLSGPIGESKASMHACGDDGLQELLYPRTVRELLLDPSPSWDLLQQAAISKTFGFPLGSDDQLAPAQLHGLLNPDIKPTHLQALLYSHDDRLSSSTASSTLSDNAEPHWPATQAGTEPAQGRTCPMHVPHTTLLQHQFDHTRVKQEYPQLSCSTATCTSSFAKPSSTINPFLLQHHQQQHSLRLINPNHDPATLLNEAAAIANMQQNADVKPSCSSRQLHSWPNSPAAAAAAIQLCRSSSSFELGGLASSAAGGDPHQLLLHSMKPQHHAHGHQLDNAGVGFPASPSLTNLISQDAAFFQPDHHQLMQQAAALQAHHHHAGGSVLNTPPLQYLNQQAAGLKSKARAHLEGGHGALEEGKDMKGSDPKSISPHEHDFNFKRPRVDPPQQQQQQQQHNTTPGSTSSFKSQPVRKEKLGERITTLQQLVSPFGKTDTASVLLEAIGYIKFLQEQVQTLSSPYLKSTNNPTSQSGDKNQNGEEAKPDLRSKGLCLVPLSCTMQVANDNGADYWYGGAFR
ncbi:hypothetical protein GOP47_0006134 [Adiantum capillus-veneris]|uniref:BHLH domain-containing protein n=1 Tax=Adiantum capillus-veneris TaxID=13818 RepID=A0A9D4V2H7_ADICA|nr:hypothetical protein GOP47_0006134 [Adiantum capillus-veneris]